MILSKTDHKPVDVTYYRANGKRLPPKDSILEDRFLHKIFLLIHIPASWGVGKISISLIVLTGLIWLGWSLLSTNATLAAGIYLTFTLADWLLLWWLPHSKRSFGPVGSQLLFITTPRVGAAVVAGLIAWLTNSSTLGITILLLLQFFGTIVYLWGTLYEPFALGTTRKSVTPAAWSTNNAPPLRLLHLSDLHIERLTRRETRLLELIAQAEPDLIVFTGDFLNLSYVDDPVARAEVRKLLAELRAPYGVYATLGSPPVDPRDATPSILDGLDIRLLRDEVAVLRFADGRSLSLIGLDCEHDLESDASALHNLLHIAPPDSARVLLYHSPELMPTAKDHPIDLYLCGHTHGGQIRLPFYGAILTSAVTGKQYEMGPYTEQNTTLYVSRGIGLEGLSAPRMRLLCPPEIILFNLSGTM